MLKWISMGLVNKNWGFCATRHPPSSPKRYSLLNFSQRQLQLSSVLIYKTKLRHSPERSKDTPTGIWFKLLMNLWMIFVLRQTIQKHSGMLLIMTPRQSTKWGCNASTWCGDTSWVPSWSKEGWSLISIPLIKALDLVRNTTASMLTLLKGSCANQHAAMLIS